MALNYPVTSVQEFAELLVYASKGLKSHYGDRYEVELDIGPQSWISEDVHDSVGRPIHHCRFAIVQTFDRELGKQWNHVDFDKYNLRSIYAAHSDAALPPDNSRSYLKWLVYAALGLKTAFPNVEHELELFFEGRASKQFRPVVFTNAKYTDNGIPLMVIEAWIPQEIERATGYGWNHVDLNIFQEPEITAVPAAFASPD